MAADDQPVGPAGAASMPGGELSLLAGLLARRLSCAAGALRRRAGVRGAAGPGAVAATPTGQRVRLRRGRAVQRGPAVLGSERPARTAAAPAAGPTRNARLPRGPGGRPPRRRRGGGGRGAGGPGRAGPGGRRAGGGGRGGGGRARGAPRPFARRPPTRSRARSRATGRPTRSRSSGWSSSCSG